MLPSPTSLLQQFLQYKDIHGRDPSLDILFFFQQRRASFWKHQQWRKGDQYFKVNDGPTDVIQLSAMKYGDHALTFVSEENINWIMDKSDIYKRGTIQRYEFAYNQSVGGKMDFNYKYTLPSQGIEPQGDEAWDYDHRGGFMVMGNSGQASVAYNLNDAGRWLWGYAMKKLGFGLYTAQFFANQNSRAAGHGPDTNADQSAIGDGHIYNVGTTKLAQGIFREPNFSDAHGRENRSNEDNMRKSDRSRMNRILD